MAPSIAEMPSRHRLLEIAEKATGDTLATASHIRGWTRRLEFETSRATVLRVYGARLYEYRGIPDGETYLQSAYLRRAVLDLRG